MPEPVLQEELRILLLSLDGNGRTEKLSEEITSRLKISVRTRLSLKRSTVQQEPSEYDFF